MVLSLSDLAQSLEKSAAQVKKDLMKISKQPLSSQFIPASLVRKYLSSLKIKYSKQVISVQMLKGGVAKTTTVLNLGLRAAMYGARVLFVDLDQQANLTFALGQNSENLPVWLDILEKKVSPYQAVIKVEENIDLIPSNLNNSVLDRVLMNSNRNWAQSVKTPLAQISDNYDLILIDTAPALSAINTAVAIASDLIILPMSPDRFSWLGLNRHKVELEEIKKDFGADFQSKILFTRFDAREKSSHEILQMCVDSFADEMMQGYIRTSAEIKNTIGTKKTIFHTQNTVREDYDLIAREILGFNV